MSRLLLSKISSLQTSASNHVILASKNGRSKLPVIGLDVDIYHGSNITLPNPTKKTASNTLNHQLLSGNLNVINHFSSISLFKIFSINVYNNFSIFLFFLRDGFSETCSY